ncbi:MAG TPA: glycosyl hydrolase family 28 protein [Opitutaceae bacterium]|nr:glycosyl hydrolase family 28 protein [Opitutaceae bacterium]
MKHLLSFLLLTAVTAFAAPREYVISDYGAVGNGTTVNTKAIQAVIDRCSTEGGGVVVVPSGTFLSGALYFKPGVDLRVDKGAVLKSTTSMSDFPPIYTRWEGIERYWTSAFLNFIGLKNVTVSGEGTIDGSGDAWAGFGKRGRPPFDRKAFEAARKQAAAAPLPRPADVYPSPLPTTAGLNFAPDAAHLPPINAAGIALPPMFGRLAPPRAIVFQNCEHVRISGLMLKNQARWGYVFLYCNDVVASHLTARAEHYIPSSDGMDIDSCRHVLVTGCDFDCNDDCISLKSGKDEDGRRVNRPCEDIVIEKTRFAYGHGGAAMGSETSGGIRNVEVRDCIAEAGNWAPVRIKTQPTRGNVVENITYRNLTLNGVKQAFEMDLEWNMRIATPAAARDVPTVRNIKIIGVHGTADFVGKIHGLKDSLVDGVTFQDCDVTAHRGLVIDHARNIDTSGLKLHVSDGEPIVWK